jgi:hypothetical protein
MRHTISARLFFGKTTRLQACRVCVCIDGTQMSVIRFMQASDSAAAHGARNIRRPSRHGFVYKSRVRCQVYFVTCSDPSGVSQHHPPSLRCCLVAHLAPAFSTKSSHRAHLHSLSLRRFGRCEWDSFSTDPSAPAVLPDQSSTRENLAITHGTRPYLGLLASLQRPQTGAIYLEEGRPRLL